MFGRPAKFSKGRIRSVAMRTTDPPSSRWAYWSRDLAPVGYADGSSGEGVDDIRTLNPSHFFRRFFGISGRIPTFRSSTASRDRSKRRKSQAAFQKLWGATAGTVVLGDDLSIDHLIRGASFTLDSVYAEMELDTNGLASGANGMPGAFLRVFRQRSASEHELQQRGLGDDFGCAQRAELGRSRRVRGFLGGCRGFEVYGADDSFVDLRHGNDDFDDQLSGRNHRPQRIRYAARR